MFKAPIPGQSLTTEPKSFPYERPPEIVDPLEALDKHIENLSNPEAIEDALYFLEMGLDMVSLVNGILRSAVMEGIHSIDVSLIIAPVLHEYLKGFAEVEGIEYDEGFENPKRVEEMRYARNSKRAKNMLKKMEQERGEEPEEEEEESLETLMMGTEPEMGSEEEVMESAEAVEEPTEEAPKGLMARI